MKITQVTFIANENSDSNTLGTASIILDELLVIHGIRLIKGKYGVFISFPQRKIKGEYKDIVFSLTKEFRENICTAILKESGYDSSPPQEDNDDSGW